MHQEIDLLDTVFYSSENHEYNLNLILEYINANLINYVIQEESNPQQFFKQYNRLKRFIESYNESIYLEARIIIKVFEESLSNENKLLLEMSTI